MGTTFITKTGDNVEVGINEIGCGNVNWIEIRIMRQNCWLFWLQVT